MCCSYVKACLGGPTPAEYDALIAERESLKKELEDARQQIAELQAKASNNSQQATASSVFLQGFCSNWIYPLLDILHPCYA
jgi:hypothetical protein